MDLGNILSNFDFPSTGQPAIIGSGHINETYLVRDNRGKKAILQRINTSVFINPIHVMSNLELILNQLDKKEYPYESFEIIPASSGLNYLAAENGFWRMLSFVEGKEAIVKPGEAKKAETIAGGYGIFLKQMNQLSPDPFHETIANFHNPESRFQQLLVSIDMANSIRKVQSQSLIDHALAFSNITIQYSQLLDQLPLRITHGDAKDSNILVDESGEVHGIVDFDTVMPGYIMNDFGDMVRSMCNSGREDERNANIISLDLTNFRGITNGLLRTLHMFLKQEELDSLLPGVKAILYEQFLRFLADYLNHDIYYHIDYEEHNLDRAKVHLKLLIDYFSKEDQLIEIINNCLKDL